MEKDNLSKEILNEKIDYLLELGKALHEYGMSAQRIEAAMYETAKNLGVDNASFFSTPTYLNMAVTGDFGQIHRSQRVNPSDVELDKLCKVDYLTDQVAKKEMKLKDASKKLAEIRSQPPRYGNLLTVLSYGVSSSSIAIVLQGSLYDSLLAFFLGIITGFMTLISSKYYSAAQIYEAIVSFTLTVFSLVIADRFILHLNSQIIIMSGLIVLLPGLGMTVAMMELATQNLVSGTARFMGSMITLLKITFGVALGVKACALFKIEPIAIEVSKTSLPLFYMAIIFAALAFTIKFRISIKDYFWVLLSALVSVGSAKFGREVFGPEIGAFVGGTAVSALSNLFARVFNRPASLLLLPGIIILVPGSVGYKTFTLFFNHNVLGAMSTGFTTIMIAISLVAGVFFGNILINPRRMV